MKKLLAAMLAAAMTLSLAACGSGGSGNSGSGGGSSAPAGDQAGSGAAAAEAGAGSVYFLNFKPEVDQVYQDLAAKYTAETQVPVKVVTAASGTYEQQLKAEMAKSEAPTIFQINGPVGYSSWKDYCQDLSGTEIYGHLTDKSIAIGDDTGVYGIPFAIEGYGIIYNQEIMDKYFALEGAKAKSVDEIKGFGKLKEVVEDMTARKADLGIDGVFAATSLAPGEDWRWQTHLANLPLYYEWQEKGTDLGSAEATATIEFKYGPQFKNIFDLYLNNSTVEPKMTGSKSVDDSMADFALGKCAMVQNGNWAYNQVAGVEGNVVKAENVKFLPIYIGVSGEDKQGLCIGTENFFCINKNASDENQKASLDFMNWLYTSDEGKKAVTQELGFIAPFDTFTDSEKPADPLAQDVLNWSARTDVTNVPWNFTIFPSQSFKDDFGAILLQYAQGSKTWDDVTKLVVDTWASEKENAAALS